MSVLLELLLKLRIFKMKLTALFSFIISSEYLFFFFWEKMGISLFFSENYVSEKIMIVDINYDKCLKDIDIDID